MDLGDGVDAANPCLEGVQPRRIHKVGLVEKNHVGECHLLQRLVLCLQVLLQVLRVGNRHDRIEAEVLLHLVVGEEGLGDGRGVSEAGRLDEDPIQPVLALEEPSQDADQVTPHRAANAAVVHLEELLLALDDKLVVDTDLAELVLYDRELQAVLLGKNSVEERGFTGS